MEERVRKVRSDKKMGINPIISIELNDALARLGYVCDRPVKDIGETLVVLALNNREIINTIARKFRRPYWYTDTIMINGDPELPKMKWVIQGDTVRPGLRFSQPHYEKISELAYALDTSKIKAAALLLIYATHNEQCLSHLLTKYVKYQLDHRRMENLRRVVDYTNQGKPEQFQINIPILLNHIYYCMGDNVKPIGKAVSKWMSGLGLDS
ncbi:hypothetical protein [Alicyclobacillus fodiniaquatilis]|uniref:Uncharacterized protein n=1 Tax=Alicyclobacillus fodiniaquatilis TaxID=1661150 RepID=A0ABW4JER4_9BACL